MSLNASLNRAGTLPVLLTPERQEPTKAQLAYVQHESFWWPAVVYESSNQALEDRHSDMTMETKTRLACKSIDAQLNEGLLGGKVANLLGFKNKWVDTDLERDIFVFMGRATSQNFNAQQRLLYQKALTQTRRILNGGTLVPPGTNLFFQETERETTCTTTCTTACTTKSLVSTKRNSDDGRIWGREQPSKKRKTTTKIPSTRTQIPKEKEKPKPPKQKPKPLPKATTKRASSAVTKRVESKKQAKEQRSNKSQDDFYVWKNLWNCLQQEGWKVKRAKNPLHDWYYFPSHVEPSSKGSTYGKDYFGNPADVIEWAKSINYREKVGVQTSSDESSMESEADGETITSADDEKSCTDEDTYMSTDDERSQTSNTSKKYMWADVWPLMRKEGWALKNDGLGTWCFTKPGVDISNAELGEDYFRTANDLLEWAYENDYVSRVTRRDDCSLQVQEGDEECTPVNNRTKPQDPAAPLLASSDSSDDETYRFEFKYLWPRLREFGWTYVNASKYNKLHDNYYVRPGRTVEGSQLGVDYFMSANDVIRFEKQQEGILDDDDQPLTQPTNTKDRRVTMSPVKAVAKAKKKEWWQCEAIPSFIGNENIWKLLRDNFKFRHVGGKYCLPAEKQGQVQAMKRPYGFIIDHDLRKFLCQNGIPNYDADKLSEEERTDLHRWTSFANVPVNSVRSVHTLKDETVLDDAQAVALLTKIHFQDLGTGRYFHSPTEKVFDSFVAMRSFVRGMNELESTAAGTGRRRGHQNVLEDHEVLRLRLWAALSPEPLPVFGETE